MKTGKTVQSNNIEDINHKKEEEEEEEEEVVVVVVVVGWGGRGCIRRGARWPMVDED
jgi:hypothetical protein